MISSNNCGVYDFPLNYRYLRQEVEYQMTKLGFLGGSARREFGRHPYRKKFGKSKQEKPVSFRYRRNQGE